MATKKTYAITKDARVYSPNLGAGANTTLPVGLWSGQAYRSFLQAPAIDWVGLNIRSLVKATLRLKNSTQVNVARGGTPRVRVRRVAESWSEGSSEALSSSNAITYDNAPATAGTDFDSGALSSSDGATVDIDVTDMVRGSAPSSVQGGTGAAFYGFRLTSFDEGSTSRTTEFWSSDSGTTSNRPQLIIEYETNSAPNAPVGLSPASQSDGSASIAPFIRSGQLRTNYIRFAATRSDSDPGDYITRVRIQVFADSATDGAPGSPIIDSTTAYSSGPTSVVISLVADALVAGTSYRARIQTADREGVWGAWSSLTAMRFRPNTIPSAPANMAQDTGLSPNFYGSLVDSDPGAAIAEARVLVYQDTPAGAVLKWDSGWVASGGTRFALAYGGSPLEYGTQYRWAGQITDNLGSAGPLSAYRAFTPQSTAGPDAMSPQTVETKLDSVTPTLTIGHSSAFDGLDLQVSRFPDGPADMYDVVQSLHASTTSKPVVYGSLLAAFPAKALSWGRTYYWRARVRVAGVTWTDWSPWFPFYINALPSQPVVTIDSAVDSGDGPSGRYSSVVSLTPTIRVPFLDPDLDKGYADVPIEKQVEIRRVDTNAVHSTYAPLTIAGTAETHVVNLAMTAGVLYRIRVRWKDSAGQFSPWSNWLLLKPVTAYTIAAGTAPDVTDPTPTLDWTTNRAQRRFSVLIYRNATGELVHNSGVVESSATEYVVPGEVLEHATAYRWEATSYDADLVPAVLT